MEGDFKAGCQFGGGDICLFIASESTYLWKTSLSVLKKTIYNSRKPSSRIEPRMDGSRTELRMLLKVFTLNKTQIHGVVSVVCKVHLLVSNFFIHYILGAISNHMQSYQNFSVCQFARCLSTAYVLTYQWKNCRQDERTIMKFYIGKFYPDNI